MKVIKWQKDMQITEPGIYEGIPLEEYHGNRNLFDGPSISKSSLKWLLPLHGGSPKAFWGRWKWNPDRVEPTSSDALVFGKAAHCLLLGDEVFSEQFIVEPEKYINEKTGKEVKWSNNANFCKDWHKAQADAGLSVIKADQLKMIRKIADDAAQYDLVKQGILNGEIERTMCIRDPETGSWVTVRPDARPMPGTYSDLKTTSSLDEDFLSRQLFDAGYYLQGGSTKMVCEALGLPIEEFYLVYVLKDDVPDTTHVPISGTAIERGERAVRWCLRTIRQCLDAGEWPGAGPFTEGNQPIYMKPWAADRLDEFLDREERSYPQEEAA